MANLKTSFLGLELKNPIVVASSPLTSNARQAQALEAAGAGALVMRSIFEEQIRGEMTNAYDALADYGTAAAIDYLRADLPMQLGPEKYVNDLKEIRKVVKIPLIASINCLASDEWVRFARKLENAGADALELNIYDIPTHGETSDAVEARHVKLVAAIKAEVKLPVVVKLCPYYTALLNFATRLQALNIAGMVLFNRFLQPDIDIESESLKYGVNLSRPDDIRLALRWTAILRHAITCDIALGNGVHNAEGVIKALLAGANAAYICSVLYLTPREPVIERMIADLATWMDRHGHADIAAFRGKLSETNFTDGDGFERIHYVKTLSALT